MPDVQKNQLYVVIVSMSFERCGSGYSHEGGAIKAVLVSATCSEEANAFALAGAEAALKTSSSPSRLFDKFVDSMNQTTYSNFAICKEATPLPLDQLGMMGFLSAE